MQSHYWRDFCFCAAVNSYYCAFVILSEDHAAPLWVTEVMNRLSLEWFQYALKKW